MTTTPQDWRVTAADQARRAAAELDFVLGEASSADEDAPVPAFADILAGMWRAAQAAEAAAGALVNAELAAGMDWDEVARALGFATAADARQALAAARAAGAQRLQERLPGVSRPAGT